jgi:hypothetical protein
MELSITPIDPPAFDLAIWDHAFREKYQSLTGKELPRGAYFSLKLESHAVLVDSFLQPSSELSLKFPDIEPVVKVGKAQTIRGWQSSWNLPKPDDIGISMGSVFLFRYDGEDLKALESHIQKLVVKGIGLRRDEGLGRISVCDPLHFMEVI